MPAWWDSFKSVFAFTRLAFALTLLAALCSVAVVVSCKRSANLKQPTQPRNLTPGLSEELSAFARRHHGQALLLVDGSGNSEEARNLTELIAKAFEAGGWKVARPGDVSLKPFTGLYCYYHPKIDQELADDLVSVLQKNGLPMTCREYEIPMPLSILVGLKP